MYTQGQADGLIDSSTLPAQFQQIAIGSMAFSGGGAIPLKAATSNVLPSTESEFVPAGAGKSSSAANNNLPTNQSQLSHIFRDDAGHMVDTPENQQALLNLINNPKSLLGSDTYGNQWYAQTLPDGTQLWASVRNGVLQNGGLNAAPKTYNPTTGLSKEK